MSGCLYSPNRRPPCRDPIDRMIAYFQLFFKAETYEQGFSLAIQVRHVCRLV